MTKPSGDVRMRLLGLVLAVFVLAPTPAQAQLLQWTQRAVSGPSPRYSHAMAHDAARGVTVLFGGYTGSFNAETWEWNGMVWTQRVVSGPSARGDSAMVYDAARGVTVCFGGTNGCCPLGETWEWNGMAWTQRMVSGPSARSGHAMAYDAARGVTVLFGGWYGGVIAETWEWNGTAWTQRMVSGPSARRSHAMAYDAARGVTVLFGGMTPDENAETWEWNGTTWTQRMVTGPSQRYLHAMAYDAARGVTVLTFGRAYNAETWEWNGTTWTQRMVTGPSARSRHAMAYDAARGVTVLFGGEGNNTSNAETWELNGSCASFASQPSSNALLPGGTASFSVAVDGTATSFQWRRNGVNLADGPRISGSATATVMISSVQASDEGAYDCVVTSACNTVTSAAAVLSCDPIILGQPSSREFLVPGLQLAVTVPASAPYSYRWRQDGQNLFNFPGFFSGATTRTLTLLSDDPTLEGVYDVVVTDSCGTVTSTTAEVRLCFADFDGDGDTGTDMDIESFFRCLGGDCCPTCGSPDFDNDGDAGTDLDIESFFRVLGGGPC